MAQNPIPGLFNDIRKKLNLSTDFLTPGCQKESLVQKNTRLTMIDQKQSVLGEIFSTKTEYAI